jgi:hypothetical protein
MRHRTTCSWCHEENDVSQPPVFCKCGHRADLPRIECDCPKCKKAKQASDSSDDVWYALCNRALTLHRRGQLRFVCVNRVLRSIRVADCNGADTGFLNEEDALAWFRQHDPDFDLAISHARLIEVCESCLHQLSTDSDLEHVSEPQKYRELMAMLRQTLEKARL